MLSLDDIMKVDLLKDLDAKTMNQVWYFTLSTLRSLDEIMKVDLLKDLDAKTIDQVS